MEGDHWAWFALAVAAFVLRRARRRPGAVILSAPMEVGDRYVVTLLDPDGGSSQPVEIAAGDGAGNGRRRR